MGNSISPCCHPGADLLVKLVFWEGTTRVVAGKRLAGEIMFEFPDRMVCHAGSFFIGRPVPALAIEDELIPGQTYFVLPLDRLPLANLSASSLSALVAGPVPAPIQLNECPFEYIKGSNGRVLIKVVPEFMVRLMTRGQDVEKSTASPSHGFLCSTPELKKHYDQLVGSKEQTWSPKLETISERSKTAYSPYRFLAFDWKIKEEEE